MDDKKFCFIVCVSDERAYTECSFYISHLRIPNGYTAELLPVRDARSMASAYNKAMNATNALYKIYIHQDCFILNPNMLNDALRIFASDPNIAMIGVMGTPRISPDGVPENSVQIGNVYNAQQGHEQYSKYEYDLNEGLYDCDYINGMLMITARDLPWREDLFDGWDFYDASQSMEFRRKGYRVVVPEQRLPWCTHEENLLNRWAYNKYRKIYVQEYLP